jgi:hypothetical protein
METFHNQPWTTMSHNSRPLTVDSSFQLSNFKVTLRPTVSCPVCLRVKPHLGPRSDFCYCRTVAGLLIWEGMSVVHNCCWLSPFHSFSVVSPAELMLVFYCLRFQTPRTSMTKSPYLYPPRTVWPSLLTLGPRYLVPSRTTQKTLRHLLHCCTLIRYVSCLTCLTCLTCVTVAASFCSTILAFSRHVTVCCIWGSQWWLWRVLVFEM